VKEVSKMLDPPVQNLVRPHRKLVRDGELPSKFFHANMRISSSMPWKRCRVFLFNDCILLTEPQKKSIFDSSVKLRPWEIIDLNNAVILEVEKSETEIRVRAPLGLVIFQAKNWPEKEAWMDDISESINKRSEHPSFNKTQSSMLVIPAHLQIPQLRSTLSTAQLPNSHVKIPRSSSPSSQILSSFTESRQKIQQQAQIQYNTISRNLTLPKIGIKTMFQRITLNAPEQGNRISQKFKNVLPRSASYNSFFSKKVGNNNDKQVSKPEMKMRTKSLPVEMSS